MEVNLHQPCCLLYSYYLKNFLSLKNNYLGVFQNHMPPTMFATWQPGKSSLGHPKSEANTLDASVRVRTIGNASIAVPVDMYSSERTILATLPELAVEVRSHAT